MKKYHGKNRRAPKSVEFKNARWRGAMSGIRPVLGFSSCFCDSPRALTFDQSGNFAFLYVEGTFAERPDVAQGSVRPGCGWVANPFTLFFQLTTAHNWMVALLHLEPVNSRLARAQLLPPIATAGLGKIAA